MTDLNWLNWVSEIQAIAQNGITFSSNEFDKERYTRLLEIAAEIASKYSKNSFEEIMHLFLSEKGYMTPKVDVRSYILKENQLLLVKERADGLWTLPGGFADINESPSEAVIRETKEETGFDVSVTRLLALWDKQKHDHPPQWPHVYKFFFSCEIISGEALENLEVSEIKFFNLNELPLLSTHRVTNNQIHRLYDALFSSDKTLFD
jgi:ADP-ribose pyrophosphatase YjhB (NUDIX family)